MTSSLFSLPFAPADDADVSVRPRLRSAAGSFIAGPENALVRTLAATVSENELRYNPIVLCGAPGVGKSSLAHALAFERRRRLGLAAVIQTTGAELAQGLANAIETAAIDEYREKHHRCDLLLIDDMQQLANKPAAQQFLLTAVDALVRRGSLVLVTMPRPPQGSNGFSAGLASRLVGGLVVKLAPPGTLARREVVRQEAARALVRLDERQIGRLVESGEVELATARGLRRAVLRLAAGNEFGLPDAPGNGTKSRGQRSDEAVCRHVALAVAKQFGVTLAELRGESRRQAIVEARSLAMHLARRLTKSSYADIGRRFGNRDHTTVLHACRKTEERFARDEFVRRLADEIASQVAAEGCE